MALNNGVLLSRGFEMLDRAECSRMASMSAFTVLILNCTTLATGVPMPEKELRKILAAEAFVRGTNKGTWEAYVSGVFGCADKLARGLPDLMNTISDLDEDGACAEIEAAYATLNVTSGGHMREWAKQEGFASYDADKVARERREAQQRKAADAMTATLAAFKASSGKDSSTLMVAAPVAPLSALDAVTTAIGALTSEADVLAALAALNTKLAEFAALAALAPAPTLAPVLSDDVEAHPLSALGRVKRRA